MKPTQTLFAELLKFYFWIARREKLKILHDFEIWFTWVCWERKASRRYPVVALKCAPEIGSIRMPRSNGAPLLLLWTAKFCCVSMHVLILFFDCIEYFIATLARKFSDTMHHPKMINHCYTARRVLLAVFTFLSGWPWFSQSAWRAWWLIAWILIGHCLLDCF